jgi:DNA polymerase sigma
MKVVQHENKRNPISFQFKHKPNPLLSKSFQSEKIDSTPHFQIQNQSRTSPNQTSSLPSRVVHDANSQSYSEQKTRKQTSYSQRYIPSPISFSDDDSDTNSPLLTSYDWEDSEFDSDLSRPISQQTLTYLHNEIQTIHSLFAPNTTDKQLRHAIFTYIQSEISIMWPRAKLYLFGSSATHLYLPCGDLDIVIQNAHPDSKQAMYCLADYLKKSEIASRVQVIATAKVPVVKCELSDFPNIRVDFLFNHLSGVSAVSLIKSYLQLYSPLPQLLFFLKIFLLQRGLNEPYTGGMSSFALILLLVSFFQHYRSFKHTPHTNQTRNHTHQNTTNNNHHHHHHHHDINHISFATLLCDFFDLYGRKFNYITTAISTVNDGVYFPKPNHSNDIYYPQQPYLPHICDPLDETNNVTRCTFQMDLIRSEFREAFVLLSTALRSEMTQEELSQFVRSEILMIGSIQSKSEFCEKTQQQDMAMEIQNLDDCGSKRKWFENDVEDVEETPKKRKAIGSNDKIRK